MDAAHAMVTDRDFAGYRGSPPPIRWPHGRQLAVSIVVNVEEGAELSVGMGDESNEFIYEAVERVELNTTILRRAAEPLPVPLKTLDALHLTTALALGYHLDAPPLMAPHDRGLARASRALGLRVTGV